MSDFIAPKESNIKDYVGMFACSAGFKEEVICNKFREEGDEYSVIMIKTLADRLAEAFAEQLHV